MARSGGEKAKVEKDGSIKGSRPAKARPVRRRKPSASGPRSKTHAAVPVETSGTDSPGVTDEKVVDSGRPPALGEEERSLLAELHATIARHAGESTVPIDTESVDRAFRFACASHVGQVRISGESFVCHPLAVAKICAGLRLDTATLCAALLHDTVEDTGVELETIKDSFGDEIANLVDGVTKLAGIHFQSRDEKQAENYRKMILAMATDIRVILIKLADRMHNMRTISALPKVKQVAKGKETLEIYAPLAHRLGIHAIKWELEDLAFQTLHPRKYAEIKDLVNQQRAERESYVAGSGKYLAKELQSVGIEVEISGRAKHFYSIYAKMTKKGREFNEIYDLTAMRVIVSSVKDCYGAVGIVHSLWKPLPGRFKDFVAMPKVNGYQALHTTVIGPEGMPLEIQIRTREMHERAEFGVAAHWIYKEGEGSGQPNKKTDGNPAWLSHMLDWQRDLTDPEEFMENLKVDLFEDEVFVFTPKGEVKKLAAGSTPLDFAYAVHTAVGHRCVGAKVNGKIVPLHYDLRSGDIVEILTSKQERGPSRDWLALVKTSRARSRIRSFLQREGRQDAEVRGRETLQDVLRKQNLPAAKVVGSPLIADVIRELGFKRADDFFVSLGQAKISPKAVASKVIERLTQGTAEEDRPGDDLVRARTGRPQRRVPASQYGIAIEGIDRVDVRLAKCCRPVPGDAIVGYISLGRGVTIHRADCSNASHLRRASPERFATVGWDGANEAAFKAELQVDAWDRTRLLEDLSRTIAELGVNIVEARCIVSRPMVKNRFVVEVGDTETLRSCVTRLRGIDSVFDAYRVTPGG